MSAWRDMNVFYESMAARRGEARRQRQRETIPLADQLFVAATLRYEQPEKELLPPLPESRLREIARWREQYRQGMASHSPEVGGVLWRWFLRVAIFLVAVGGAFVLFQQFADDTIRIVDESGQSALGSELQADHNPVRLRLLRRRHKIGEITITRGTRIRVVRASNGDSLRSELAISGKADLKLQYQGGASVVVNSGYFKANVRIPQSAGQGIHLRISAEELPPHEVPQLAIEVLSGSVQIAEADNGDEFEHYHAGEKAIFSLEEDSENL
ncbi:MAG: hypothetical protein N2Z22_03075 [Turneriella sp.]|nr:hypothetical protein [Turneriella sp.]